MISEEQRGKGNYFHRLRRITGYLVGDMSRWNSGKKAEEHDRVKHTLEVENNGKTKILQSEKYTS